MFKIHTDQLKVFVKMERMITHLCISYCMLSSIYFRFAYTDECTDAIDIGDERRSVNYSTPVSLPPLCDRGRVTTGMWYKFLAPKTGYKMATGCVPDYYCGTYSAIFMDGDNHPTSADPGPVSATVCISSKCPKTSCSWSKTIQVKYCNISGDVFFAYKLVKPNGCEVAYCAGKGQPCPLGEYYNSINGSCMAGYPAMDSTPLLEGPFEPSDFEEGQFKFHCSVSYSGSTTGATFEIQWYANGTIIADATTTIRYPETFGVLKEEKLINHAGKYISCAARSYWDNSKNKSEVLSSRDKYFIGITVSPVVLGSSDREITIVLQSSVPITCGTCMANGKKCYELPYKKNLCQVKFQVTPYTSRGATGYTCEPIFQLGENISTLKAKNVDTTSKTIPYIRLIKFETYQTNKNRIWDGYTIGPIPVSVTNEVGSKTCSSVTDPHYTTFDGKQFDIYEPGNFLLVKSNSPRIFEVQTHLRRCERNDKVSCNCGVAVREGNTIIGVDNCEGLGSDFRTFKKVIGTIPNNATLLTEDDGRKLTITMPSGAKVVAEEDKYWHMNVYVTLPSEDEGNTYGLCGIWDGNPDNDFTIKGTNTAENNSGRRPMQFISSYRLNDTESFFDGVPECLEITMNVTDFCKCENDRIINCVYQDNRAFTSVVTDVCHQTTGKRKKKSINSLNAFFKSFEDLKPETNFTIIGNLNWPTASGITEQQAQDKCMSVVSISAVYSQCNSLANFDINNAKSNCKSDILVSDDLSAGDSILQVFQSNCLQSARENIIVGASNESATLEIARRIEANICLNQCSGNGTCINGTCDCFPGLYGSDCSVPAGVAPVISNIETLCDRRTGSCDVITITASPMISDLKCRWKMINTDTGNQYITNSTLITKQKTFCTVPTSTNESLSLYNFSISIDGETYSEEKEITIYDSKCIKCDGSCNLRVGTCVLEDGKCYDGSICDACVNAINIGDPKRSSVYKLQPSDVSLCDSGRISPGHYYWFNQYTGNKVSETCIDEFHCGTFTPLWINGTHPTETNPVQDSTVCANTNSNCCYWTSQVKIRYCMRDNETYYAYQLPKPPYCEWAYCSGSIMPCNDTEVWDNLAKQCIDIDECLSQPCINGHCVNLAGKFECRCLAGYTGMTCSVNINECQPNPCEYGTCTDLINGYSCTCLSGYTGSNCTNNIDECLSSPCNNNATCKDVVNGYNCECPTEYTGTHCTLGQWNSWESWSTCSVSCDYGHMVRTRSCMVHQLCNGDSTEYSTCRLDTCTAAPDASSSISISANVKVPKEYLPSIVINETLLKISIAEAINNYCTTSPQSCCSALGLSYTRTTFQTGTNISSSSLVTIKQNGLVNDETMLSLLISVNVMVRAASSLCSNLDNYVNDQLVLSSVIISDAIELHKDEIKKITGITISDSGKQVMLSTTTELPNTGNNTWIIIGVVTIVVIAAVVAIIICVVLKMKNKQKGGENKFNQESRPSSPQKSPSVTSIPEITTSQSVPPLRAEYPRRGLLSPIPPRDNVNTN